MTWLSTRPGLFYGINRLRGRPGLVGPHTDITIEGFPRSANTFAVRAFQMANPASVIASHWHAVAQLSESVRREVPLLVVVREPESAVKSLLVRRPELSPQLALRAYVVFHEETLRLADRLVIAPFEEVTTNFGRSIERVNARFRRTFNVFRHEPASERAIFDAMDARNRAAFGGQISPRHVPRPDPQRESLKAQVWLAGCDREMAIARRLSSDLAGLSRL